MARSRLPIVMLLLLGCIVLAVAADPSVANPDTDAGTVVVPERTPIGGGGGAGGDALLPSRDPKPAVRGSFGGCFDRFICMHVCSRGLLGRSPGGNFWRRDGVTERQIRSQVPVLPCMSSHMDSRT